MRKPAEAPDEGEARPALPLEGDGASADPTLIEEYRLLRPLGRGAMGQVYLAHDGLLDRPVAIKFIRGVPDAAARERFFIEARAIARLSHPNVVSVHRVGEARGRPYLVSELVRGTPLDRLARPLEPEQALEIAIGLARGLAAAHRRGVLHRDIKPANAMLAEDGQVKLLDFGLAKLSEGRAAPLPSAPAVAAAAGEDRDPEATRPGRRAIEPPPQAEPLAATQPGARSPELTAVGAMVGSPLYMAPEVWRGEPASASADIYSLGVLLYELCAGQAPHHGVPLAALPLAASQGAPPLCQAVPWVPAALGAIIDRCLMTDPAARYPSGDALREALEQLHAIGGTAAIPDGNPYRGLHAFESDQRALFFGRGADIRAVLDRLREAPILLVCGDSGVGKSSLCRAGVLPLLAEGALDGGKAAPIVRLVPGVRPLLSLGSALGVPAARCGEPDELLRALRRDGAGRACLFVDQMEELLTLAAPAEAAAFAETLVALLPAARVIGTVRSDFLGRLAALPALGELAQRALYLLRPLSEAGLLEAVTGPAQALGHRFESQQMIDALLQAGKAPGGLPLLQFTLAALWEARDLQRQLIPATALLALGGVAGALSRQADGTLDQLLPGQRALARRLLVGLVTSAGTRARRTRDELLGPGGAGAEVLEALVAGRLISSRGSGDEAGYELAHEALLQSWGTLRGWLGGDAERRAARERLDRATREWRRLDRAPEALWGALQLDEAAALLGEDLSEDERLFLGESRRRARRRRWLRRGGVVALPALLLLIYAGARLQQRRDAALLVGEHLARAEGALRQGRALAEQGQRLRQQALSGFDSHQPTAEAAWAEALGLSARAAARHAEAARALEGALMIDGRRADVRARFAEVLYQQALLAELDHRLAQRDELLSRLGTYDQEQTWTRAAAAPATLTLTSAPIGAQVRAQRYLDRDGERVLGPAQELGATPLQLALPPASYLLTLQHGTALMRAPVLLGRGEALALHLDLPRRVPSGYVYVPPGRFLFGSHDDETLRRDMLGAVPLHARTTAGYLIGRTEVTFVDWIDYLRVLPPTERQRRLPRARTSFSGSLELIELPDGGFALHMQPSAIAYRAREGERVRYPERDRRAQGDWRRFPVAGISWQDAVDYCAWLSQSGRLPGARLCSEEEWERAARGADDRRFPHGDRLAPDDANFDETYGRRPGGFGPDEVGAHPRSASPFLVHDLAGNVWEWVRAADPGAVMFRGGGFYQDQLSSRSNNHQPGEPTLRGAHIGLRVCATWGPDQWGAQ